MEKKDVSKSIAATVMNSIIFQDMTGEEADNCLKCCNSRRKTYQKDEIIFHQGGTPEYLYVLEEGTVSVCKDSLSGKKSLITAIEQKGDLFGEVYIFLNKQEYDYYAAADSKVTVLMIPREAFYNTCSNNCEYHRKLIRNMLSILAGKAYGLNRKLQLLSSGSLRQKIIKYLLDNQSSGIVSMNMKREVFADYLNVARPSLSRELLKMQDAGLITLEKKSIRILNPEQLENEI